MIVLTTKSEITQYIQQKRLKNGLNIGFVPTMGALHEGHLSLIRLSKQENHRTICSIFINPTQFNQTSDFEKYPKNFEKDILLLEQNGCDILFLPNVEEMYPTKSAITFDFGRLERVMEGLHRPNHFNGVGIVVSKLFNIIQPTRAYFGQKDLQQCAIITQLVNDLSFPIEIKRCPIVREKESGLAMSSRNQRLSVEEKEQASILYQALNQTKHLLQEKKSIQDTLEKISNQLKESSFFKVEYLEVVDGNSLESLEKIEEGQEVAICIAGYIGEIRLIDNLIFVG